MSKLRIGLAALAVSSVALLLACGTEEAPRVEVVEQEVIRTVVVEKVVEVEKEVVREVEVEVPIEVEKEVIREVQVEVPVEVEKEVIREVVVVATAQVTTIEEAPIAKVDIEGVSRGAGTGQAPSGVLVAAIGNSYFMN